MCICLLLGYKFILILNHNVKKKKKMAYEESKSKYALWGLPWENISINYWSASQQELHVWKYK